MMVVASPLPSSRLLAPLARPGRRPCERNLIRRRQARAEKARPGRLPFDLSLSPVSCDQNIGFGLDAIEVVA